jgi:dTDP-4-dehydrorhamnose 3,5-epimerase
MPSRFDILDTPLDGLKVVRRKPLTDERGFLERLFCSADLESVFGLAIAQVNHTLTRSRGTVRGMHFQHPPHAEVKLVSCLRGKVFDVAVDLRHGSPTFMHWHGEVLSEENHLAMAIPAGFAHGFQTLEDDCEMLYFHSEAYEPGAEGGLHPLDPRLRIEWPLAVAGMSPRDALHPMLCENEKGITL